MTLQRRRFAEALILLALMLVSLFVPALKSILVIAPIIYFMVEWKVRRGDESLWGAMAARFLPGLRAAWFWIVLVAVVSQIAFLLVFKYLSPDTLAHIRDRLPSNGELNGQLMLAILIAPLGEEISFRALFQERFGWYMPVWAAIGLSSLLFAVMHFSSGPAVTVFWDLLSVFVDSVLFGIIYAKTKNILVAYFAHLLADIIGMILSGIIF